MCQLLRESSRAGEGSNHLLGALQICPPGKATRCAISETAAGRRQGEQQQRSQGAGQSECRSSVSVSVGTGAGVVVSVSTSSQSRSHVRGSRRGSLLVSS